MAEAAMQGANCSSGGGFRVQNLAQEHSDMQLWGDGIRMVEKNNSVVRVTVLPHRVIKSGIRSDDVHLRLEMISDPALNRLSLQILQAVAIYWSKSGIGVVINS